MTDRFVAIDVHEGDAFYLEIAGETPYTILVDGGENYQKHNMPFSQQFKNAFPGRTGVDLLVCTHCDNDHVLGLIDFLTANLKAQELWVPDQWFDYIQFYSVEPGHCIVHLVDEIANLDPAEVEALASTFQPRETPPSEEEAHRSTHPQELERASSMEEEEAQRANRLVPLLPDALGFAEHQARLYARAHSWSASKSNLMHLVLSLIVKAEALVDLAHRKGVQVKWFALNAVTPAGGNQHLKPLNCEEVPRQWKKANRNTNASLPKDVERKVNENGLVFYAPATEGRPVVLFSGDSNYSFLKQLPQSTIPWMPGMLITTPHHGAKTYGRLAREYKGHLSTHGPVPTVWVRSDKQTLQRPAPWYIDLPKSTPATTYCTRCRSHSGEQRVELHWTGTAWAPVPSGQLWRCQCK